MSMLLFFNTRTRQKEPFRPLHDRQVGLYTCGPTVYNYAHIGNLRTYLFEDTLKRALRANEYTVMHVMNITDVGHLTDDGDQGEDKMEKGARREGKSAWDIAAYYTDAFKKDLVRLNILPPDIWCKATDHIPEQIGQIKTLIAKGYTYATKDGIYFDTTKMSDYGALARLDRQTLRAGARVEMGEKKNPHDFALWKYTPAGERRQMEWIFAGARAGAPVSDAVRSTLTGEERATVGFPGWHIECSAMSIAYLGEQFDIHCGGIDHIPVHHTNEIAQAESATGKKPWVQYWLHGEFLQIADAKMAKSGENFITLQTLEDRGISALAYRYFVLQAHYRKQLAFSWEALRAAEEGLERLFALAGTLNEEPEGICPEEEVFFAAVNDDLNTPEALAALWKMLRSDAPTRAKKAALLRMDALLGLGLDRPPERAAVIVPPEVETLLAERLAARQNKEWKKSDRLRDEIARYGFVVEDAKDGTQRVKKADASGR